MNNGEFHDHVIASLARIEERVNNFGEAFDRHVTEDDDRFEKLSNELKVLVIDKKVAERAGARAGATYGTGVTAVLLTTAEVLRLWLS